MSGLEESHKSLHYDPPEAEIGYFCSGECGNADEPHPASLDDEKKIWTYSEDIGKGSDLTEKKHMWLEDPKEKTTS